MHSEGINAGEMKHGPLALVDDKLPIVVVSTMDSMHSKMAGVIQQVGGRQRGAGEQVGCWVSVVAAPPQTAGEPGVQACLPVCAFPSPSHGAAHGAQRPPDRAGQRGGRRDGGHCGRWVHPRPASGALWELGASAACAAVTYHAVHPATACRTAVLALRRQPCLHLPPWMLQASTQSSRCRAWTTRCRRWSTSSRCSCCPTTSPRCAASTWTSPATWRSR